MCLRVQHRSNHILLFHLFVQKATGHISFKKRILSFIKSLKTISPGDQWQRNEVITVLCICDFCQYTTGQAGNRATADTPIYPLYIGSYGKQVLGWLNIEPSTTLFVQPFMRTLIVNPERKNQVIQGGNVSGP